VKKGPVSDIGGMYWKGVLQRVSYSDDGGGGRIADFTDIKEFWVKQKRVFPRQENIVSDHQQTRETVIFTVHFIDGLLDIDTESHVFCYPLNNARRITRKRYKILAVEAHQGNLMYVDIRCDGEGWESV
jgi:hypothetical protein